MTEPTITCPTCAARIPLTESLAAARADLEAQVDGRVAALRQDLAAEAAAASAQEVANMAATLAERDARLAEAQVAQAEALRKTRALDAAHRELELTIEKRVGDVLAQERAKARAEGEEALRLKVVERETQIAAMAR